jgi:hypothetical protein
MLFVPTNKIEVQSQDTQRGEIHKIAKVHARFSYTDSIKNLNCSGINSTG